MTSIINAMFHFLVILAIFLLSSCKPATLEEFQMAENNGVSQRMATEVDHACFEVFRQESLKKFKNRWSNWAKCKKEKTMPLEMQIYELEEAEIVPVYDNFILRMQNFEKIRNTMSETEGQKILDEIYALHDKEKKQIGTKTCKSWVDNVDGSGTKMCLQNLINKR